MDDEIYLIMRSLKFCPRHATILSQTLSASFQESLSTAQGLNLYLLRPRLSCWRSMKSLLLPIAHFSNSPLLAALEILYRVVRLSASGVARCCLEATLSFLSTVKLSSDSSPSALATPSQLIEVTTELLLMIARKSFSLSVDMMIDGCSVSWIWL